MGNGKIDIGELHVIGGPGSGKRNFLASLALALSRNDSRWNYADNKFEINYYDVMFNVLGNPLPGEYPFLAHKFESESAQIKIGCIDPDKLFEESLENIALQDREITSVLRQSKGIFFLVDPLTLLNSQYELNLNRYKWNPAPYCPEKISRLIINILGSFKIYPPGKKFDIPLALLYTKDDIHNLSGRQDETPFKLKALHNQLSGYFQNMKPFNCSCFSPTDPGRYKYELRGGIEAFEFIVKFYEKRRSWF